jgi:GNAT superfamily N-acetyltransferase
MDDLICICSARRLSDPIHQQGIRLKKQWLREMLRKYGSVAKIAYYEDTPAAQILYYPEEAELPKPHKRENIIVINCIYNPTSRAQKLGLGTGLLQNLIQDVKHGKSCLGNKPCRFLLAKAFKTGEFLAMSEFYEKNGFVPASEGENKLYFPVAGKYEPSLSLGNYEPLPEDKGKAIIFYSPICQFGYPFAQRTAELIREAAPHITIQIINEWEKPEDSMRRKNCWLVVNAKPIQTFFMESGKFKEEIRQATSQN